MNNSETKKENLIKLFKASVESEEIQLDNLDWGKLVFDEDTGEVVVENEHGTQFPLEDLSENEIDIFLFNL